MIAAADTPENRVAFVQEASRLAPSAGYPILVVRPHNRDVLILNRFRDTSPHDLVITACYPSGRIQVLDRIASNLIGIA